MLMQLSVHSRPVGVRGALRRWIRAAAKVVSVNTLSLAGRPRPISRRSERP
jgi:hypothetical protein